MSQLLPPSRIGINKWIWWIALICITTLLLARIDRIIRRLAPLSALLQLSLVFPDEAPSRYKSAMRSFSARKVQSRLDSMKDAGFTFNAEENRSQQMLDMLTMLSDHDRLTRGHSERVRAYAEMIGAEMGLPDSDMEKLQWAALLHDLGKLTVPGQILNKPGKPDDDEWRILSSHPAAGVPLAAPIADWLGEWTSAIGQHHERWDGKGYPDGFAGNDIPLGARIVAVADAYDVMTSTRSYKKPFTAEVARQEIATGAGSQFCPSTARAFLAVPAGRLKAVAGPLSWLGGLPGLKNVPVAELVGSSTLTAASATLTAVSALAVVPSLVPLPASATEAAPAPVLATTTTTSSTTTSTTTTELPADPAEVVIAIPTAGTTAAPPIVGSTTTTTTTTPPTTTTTGASTTTSTTSASSTTTPPATTTTTSPPATTTTTTTPPTTTTTTTPPTNNAPTAFGDAASVLEGAGQIIDLVGNDIDPDPGDTLTIDSVTPAGSGTVVNNGDGTVTYTHDGSQTAVDSFSYTISDTSGATDSATVTVTVANTNDAPIALDDGFATAPNTPIVLSPAQLVANDSDEEDGAAPGATTLILAAPSPTGATVSQPGGAGTDITLTPDPGEMGPQVFGYQICDTGGACDTASVTVSIDNGFGILISEFSTDGAYSQGNFIELYNASGAPIDVAGWELRLAEGSSDPADAGTWTSQVTLAGPNTVIPPGGHYLIGDASKPIAASSDQTISHSFRDEFGVGLHDGSNYIDVVGNREQPENGPRDEATLVDGRGVTPLKKSSNFELSYVRRPGLGDGHCQDVDDNQYDWERTTNPTPESSSDPIVTCSTPTAGPQAAGVVISEFRTDGPFSTTNEFIELFNPTAAAIDITGLQLRNHAGSDFLTVSAFSLQPGQHYLVGGLGYSGSLDQTYASGGPTNTGAIELWDPVGLTQIDYVDVGISPPALPSLGQRLFDTYERRDDGCRDTDIWIDDFTFQLVISPQTSTDPFTPCP